MTSLITLSHGSRHPNAVAGIEVLTQRAAALADVAHWQCAHLEFNEPDLATAAQQLAARGETEAVVVPLLLLRATTIAWTCRRPSLRQRKPPGCACCAVTRWALGPTWRRCWRSAQAANHSARR